MSKNFTVHLKYWKQAGPKAKGHFEEKIARYSKRAYVFFGDA